MNIEEFIHRMPKVELHVHLEGSIHPATLLMLAKRNNVALPAKTMDELNDWYQFTGFDHFIEVYMAICSCIQSADDLELITTEFIKNRAEENILYSEVIYTPFTHIGHIPLDDQLAAINRARRFGEEKLGVQIFMAPDISRERRPIEDSFIVADWAVKNRNNGIVSLGLGGPEINNPPELFAATFERIKGTGLASTPHAGETMGADSIWGAINALKAVRIGHGVRCLEDPTLVSYLREKKMPLEVCPSSNVCLRVVPTLADHPLPKLMNEGLFITINSDDPAMFNTSLTEEYLRITREFGFNPVQIRQFIFNGLQACLLPEAEKQNLEEKFAREFDRLESEIE
jgi:adenosine deaminase